MKKRIHQIELFQKYPHDVQQEWFRKLVNSAKDTEWGKEFDYSSITKWETYKQRVPIQSYDTLKPYIYRVCNGEQNVLWNTDIKWFAKSSGTTSDKSKFIPVSQESLEDCHFKGGMDLLSMYCNNFPETQLFTGKGLALGGSEHTGSFNNDAYYGDLSAVLINNLPMWADFLRTPKVSIALMGEWESKIEELAKATIPENVTNIAGVPSWMLVLMNRILEITGKTDISEVWPNLELYMHGGVNFEPYRAQFAKLMPSAKMNYVETYNASEGFFGIQDRSKSDEMLLMLDYGIFYEFIPIENIDDEHPNALSLDDVEMGRSYAIVITTNAGLWRYMIGDTIEFTCLNPHRIKITGRTRSFINAFGEELIVNNADKALSIACEKTNAVVREYTACPLFYKDSAEGAHEWLIEFVDEPDDMNYFIEVLDNALKSQNSDYEAKRYRNMVLHLPVVKSLKPDTFYKWLKQKGKLGGQHKVPRLANHRKHVEEILAMN